MANKTISELNEATTVYDSEVLLVETSSETKKVTKANLLKEVRNELNEVKNSVSSGKSLIADAITDKGVQTSATATFQTMATNIRNIETSEGGTFYGSIVVDKSTVNVNNNKTDFIKVKLSQRPSSNQVITLSCSSSNVLLSPYSLTFTPSNWNEEQSVVISYSSQDYVDHTEMITLSSPNVLNRTVTVNVTNSELAQYGAIVISSTHLTFNKGESTTFTVKLDKAPSSNQTVNLSVDDGNVSLSTYSVTFTPSNYNHTQTVTVSSAIATTATITLSSSNVASKSIGVTVKEVTSGEEGSGNLEIRLSEESFTMSENSSYYLSYSIIGSLNEGEERNLTITCNDSYVNLSHSQMIINSRNINESFYISLNTQQTSLASGRTAKLTFSGTGITTKTVSFTITNNNGSGSGQNTYGDIVLDKTNVSITDSETVTIGVKLSKAPSINQLVTVSANNGYVQVDKTGLTFNSSNYSSYQYVTVRKGQSLSKEAMEASTTYQSTLTFASEGVSNQTVSVAVTITDPITPSETYGNINVSHSVISIDEGSSTTFTIRLESAPSSNQTVNITVSSSDVANVYPSTLTFTPHNYSSNQTVTVQTVKDTTSYMDKSTQITISSTGVDPKSIYLTVRNTDQNTGGDIGGSEDTDTYLPLPDTSVRNLVPYISTYYIKPTVATNEDIILNYFVTDYYGRSYTNDSNFYNYKIVVKRQDKSDIITRNVSAGDHMINLGSYAQEGTYHFSILAIDQYGRQSHELFNYVRVRNSNSVQIRTYNVTTSDLSSYNIIYDNNKEELQYVQVSGANFDKIENDSHKSIVQSAIDNAYNSSSASSGKYKVFVPIFGDSTSGNYKGKTKGWQCLKVKYGSGFNKDTFQRECATNRQNIQRLLDDKAKQGYNKIVMHSALYMVDDKPIDIPNGVTLDLNRSTIKMCPITGNGALIMRMTDCTDTHLCNGTIEGDYFAHDYANSTSNSEWVSGIEMGGSCRYSSINNVTIKNITGYGLQNSISSTSPNGNTFFHPVKVGNLTQGDIDTKTGQDIPCSYRLRSEAKNISAYKGNSDYISMSIHLNYQGNEFSSWNYWIYFYDSANQFIRAISAYQYRQVKIPTNAYYARIVIFGERLKSSWELHYQFFRVPTHCEFRNVTIDNARCVGMAQGQMKDFLVQDCVITNSGQSSATCAYDAEDGWDGMQDAFFENVRITDCPHNGFLTCAGHNFCVNNMHSDALYMWERTRWALVKNSTFDSGCVVRGGGEANIVQHGVTRFYNNIVNAPSYVNYMFMNVAKNCTFAHTLNNGIVVNSTVGGSSITRTVYNNDSSNQITDDIGKMTDNIDYGNTGGQTVPVTGITLNRTSITLGQGATEQLMATVTPSNATNQSVTWTSSSSIVATVSQSGLVTGIGLGSATITATTVDGNKTATCSVNVTSSGSSGGSGGNGSYTVVVSSSATVDSGNNLNIDFSVDRALPSNCAYEIRRYGSYWCSASLVSTNRVNVNTSSMSAGTYDNLTLTILSGGSVIATSNTFTLTINQYRPTESATLSPASCSISVGQTQVFTLMNTTQTIRTCYVASGNGTITGNTSTTVTIRAERVGAEYLNVVLQDGTSLSASIIISANTSGGGSNGGSGESGGGSDSGSGGGNGDLDSNGFVIIKYPAIQKPKPTAWCALGDSITAGAGAGGSSYSYANVCARNNGIDYMYNYGISGSCISAGYNTALTEPPIEQAFCNRYNEMSDYGDLITVFGSVNDHRADVKIGSPSSTDKNDFYGALYVLITGLKQKYPTGRIVFITPFRIGGYDGANMYGHTLKDFRNAIVEQCNRFQLEVVDLFNVDELSWLKGIHSGYFVPYDHYHPTVAGHQAIATYLGGQIFGGGSNGGSNGGSGGSSTTYGNIVVSNSSLTMYENQNTTITVKLDKAPSGNQTVYISTSGNVSTNTSSLTFNSSNYNSGQSLIVYSGYVGSGSVTLSSSNVANKTINVTINSISGGGSGGSGGGGSNGGGSTGGATITPSSATIATGSTQTFTLSGTSATIQTVYMANGKCIIYTQSGTSVTIQAMGEGKDYLNIILTDETSFSIPITVGASGGNGSSGGTNIPVTGITVDAWEVNLQVGQTRQMVASVIPSNATNQTIYWTTSATDVATVSSNGLITAKKEGYSLVVATTADGNYPYNIHVNVSGSSSGGDSGSGGGSGSGGNNGGSNSEMDSNGLVIIKYPVTKKSNPTYWGALGDSITAGAGAGGSSYSYANVAARTIGANIHNHGVSGSCINDGYNLALTEPGYDQAFCNRYTQMANGLDLITVFGSVNDHRADSKLGVEGSTDSKDFYGALHVLITGLKQKYPTSRIVFITPFKIGGWDGRNLYGHSLTDFRNAIVTMCNKHQLEVLDLFTVKDFEWLKGVNSGYFMPYDYYHPTVAGHQAIATYLVDKMFGGSSSGGSGSTGGGSGSGGGSSDNPILSPSSATIAVGNTQTFNVSGTSATITSAYVSTGRATITSQSSTSVTVRGVSSGTDYLNVSLTNGKTLSATITVTGSSSGGGGSSSGGSGGNTTIDGLVTIQHPATKQNTVGEWVAFGNSITYGFGVGGNDQAYPARVARVSSLRANNHGESGRVVATGASGATVPDARSFCNYYSSLPSGANLVTVFGGVNDFILGVPLGSPSSTDKSTFYGALNVLADGLKSKYPSGRITFFTPIRIGGHATTNKSGHTLKDYRNAIVTVCNNKGLEVLDLYSLDSMDANISVSNYMGDWDTTHPNGNGQQVIADYMVQQMLGGTGGGSSNGGSTRKL